MSRAGSRAMARRGEAGFTLFEMLAVMVVLGMAIVAVSALYQGPSPGVQVKAAAQLTASRLRDLRATALSTGSARTATIDVNGREIRFSDGRPSLQLGQSIGVAVTGAESERLAKGIAGVRFFPNGSSTGATIVLRSERQGYEVRINWLTGRVSTTALE